MDMSNIDKSFLEQPPVDSPGPDFSTEEEEKALEKEFEGFDYNEELVQKQWQKEVEMSRRAEREERRREEEEFRRTQQKEQTQTPLSPPSSPSSPDSSFSSSDSSASSHSTSPSAHSSDESSDSEAPLEHSHSTEWTLLYGASFKVFAHILCSFVG